MEAPDRVGKHCSSNALLVLSSKSSPIWGFLLGVRLVFVGLLRSTSDLLRFSGATKLYLRSGPRAHFLFVARINLETKRGES